MIIRRPHAYHFIQDLTVEHGGIAKTTPTGIALVDGTQAPLPGIYLLKAEGELLGSAPLRGQDVREELVSLLRSGGS